MSEFTFLMLHAFSDRKSKIIYSIKTDYISGCSPKNRRWVLKLQRFDFEVVYRAGRKNHVDALSRIIPLNKIGQPVDDLTSEDEDPLSSLLDTNHSFMISASTSDLLEDHYHQTVDPPNVRNLQFLQHQITVKANRQNEIVKKFENFINQIELSPNRVGDKIEIILTAVPKYKADSISLRPRPPFTPTRTSSSSLKKFSSQQLFDSIRDSMNQHASI